MRWCVRHTTWRERFASTLRLRVWNGAAAEAIPKIGDIAAPRPRGGGRRLCSLGLPFLLLTIFVPITFVRAAGLDEELTTLAAWMTGSFDTFEQVEVDLAAKAAYTHLRAVMHITPVLIPGLSGENALTFYVEQAAADAQHAPYRQRVYLLTRRGGALVNRTYRIGEPQRFVGGHLHPERLAALTADALNLEPGCDLIWTRVHAQLYSGVAGLHGSCRTAWRGAASTVSQVLMTPTSITSLDQGFDEEGRHVWGPPPGTVGHVFRKRGVVDEPAPAVAAAREFARLRAGDENTPVFWYLEGTLYRVDEDGTYRPENGLAGFNVAHLEPSSRPGEVGLVRSREIFFLTDLARTELRPVPPIAATVELGIGVRHVQPAAGLRFSGNGRDASEVVPPSPILVVQETGTRRFFVRPFAHPAAGSGWGWASESYEFIVPGEGREAAATLVWQRDSRSLSLGRVHYLATGRRWTSVSALAASSPLAAAVVHRVQEGYPEFLHPPPRGGAVPSPSPSLIPTRGSPGDR